MRYSVKSKLLGLTLLAFYFGPAAWFSLSAQQLAPLTQEQAEAQAITPDSTAVTDISNLPMSWRDIFAKGSPFHFGLAAGETYDDNIFISPRKTADFLTNITPSIDFEIGDRTSPHMNYLNVYFAATEFIYARNPNQNRQDYDADVFYEYQWTRLTLGVEQHYQHLTDASIDIGNLATRDIYTTAFNGNYVYNTDLTLFGSATQRVTRYADQGAVNTNEWIMEGYGLYQVAPKLLLGGGPRLGFVDILGAPNQAYQDVLLHMEYNRGGKISATFSGGLEYLQYQNNSPSHLLPTFDLTVNYRPREGTTLSVSGSRQNANSYDLVGQNIENTSVQFSLRQEFLRDIYFTASAGYTLADYEFGSTPVEGNRRRDRYYFANAGVEWQPKTWLKVDGRYQRSEDSSNFQQNSFQDNQIGVESSVQF